MQDTPSMKPGRRFGRYQLLEPLGSGGMADVYKAELEGVGGFGKIVALKVFREHLSRDPQFARTFVSEARLGGFLDHPNIIATLDFGRQDGRLFMAMEYVRGITLQQAILEHRRAGQPLPVPLVLELFRQVCDALEYAHGATDHGGNPLRMVHRDLKPSNLLIDLLGTVKVADFGVARAESNVDQTLVPGTLKGTVRYMSPEQARGGTDIDRRSDIFALGLVLYECVALRPCYDGTTLEQILAQAQEARVEARLAALPEIPGRDAVLAVLARAVARDVSRRFQTCGEMRAALVAALQRFGPRPDVAAWVKTRTGLVPTTQGPLEARHHATTVARPFPPAGNPPGDEVLEPTALSPAPGAGAAGDPTVRVDPNRTVVSRKRGSPAQARETVVRPYFPALGHPTRIDRPWTMDNTLRQEVGANQSALTPTAGVPPATLPAAPPLDPTVPLARRNAPGSVDVFQNATVVMGGRRIGPETGAGLPSDSSTAASVSPGGPRQGRINESRGRRWFFWGALPLVLVALLFWGRFSSRPGGPALRETGGASTEASTGSGPGAFLEADEAPSETPEALEPGDRTGQPRGPERSSLHGRTGTDPNQRAVIGRSHRTEGASSGSTRTASKPEEPVRPPGPAPVPGPGASGTLYLSSRPPARITIDGQAAERFPVQDLPVEPGAHRIEFAWPDSTRDEHVVQVEAGRTVRCVAEQASGRIRCRSD